MPKRREKTCNRVELGGKARYNRLVVKMGSELEFSDICLLVRGCLVRTYVCSQNLSLYSCI